MGTRASTADVARHPGDDRVHRLFVCDRTQRILPSTGHRPIDRRDSGGSEHLIPGDERQALLEWTPKVYEKLRTLPGFADVNSDQQNRGLEIALQIDRQTAARMGVTAQAVDNTVYDAFGQRQVSTMYTRLNQYHSD